jgi:RNA recognition motif-containing protein
LMFISKTKLNVLFFLKGQEAKTNNPISDNDWKRNLYVRGLSTSTRPQDLQKHLLKVGNKPIMSYKISKFLSMGFHVFCFRLQGPKQSLVL